MMMVFQDDSDRRWYVGNTKNPAPVHFSMPEDPAKFPLMSKVTRWTIFRWWWSCYVVDGFHSFLGIFLDPCGTGMAMIAGTNASLQMMQKMGPPSKRRKA